MELLHLRAEIPASSNANFHVINMFSPVLNSNRSVNKGQSVCFSVQGWKKLLSDEEVDSIRQVSGKHSSVMIKFNQENSTIED